MLENLVNFSLLNLLSKNMKNKDNQQGRFNKFLQRPNANIPNRNKIWSELYRNIKSMTEMIMLHIKNNMNNKFGITNLRLRSLSCSKSSLYAGNSHLKLRYI